MPRTDKLELIYKAMLVPEEEVTLSPGDWELLTRVQFGYTAWLEHSTHTDP